MIAIDLAIAPAFQPARRKAEENGAQDVHKLPLKDGSGKLPPPLILHWPHFSAIPHQPAREVENVLLILAGCPAINHALFYKEERNKWIIRNK